MEQEAKGSWDSAGLVAWGGAKHVGGLAMTKQQEIKS